MTLSVTWLRDLAAMQHGRRAVIPTSMYRSGSDRDQSSL